MLLPGVIIRCTIVHVMNEKIWMCICTKSVIHNIFRKIKPYNKNVNRVLDRTPQVIKDHSEITTGQEKRKTRSIIIVKLIRNLQIT